MTKVPGSSIHALKEIGYTTPPMPFDVPGLGEYRSGLMASEATKPPQECAGTMMEYPSWVSSVISLHTAAKSSSR